MIRVAITTDRFESASLPFSNLGLEPVPLPCIRVDPASPDTLTEAREAAATCDLLVISSVRTLDVLWPGGFMPPVEVAAIGQQTAAVVAERGGRMVASGRGGLADLIDKVRDRLVQSGIVFPHGITSEPSAGGLVRLHRAMDLLRGQASHLREFEVYRTISQPPGPGDVEAVAFASPTAVAGWHMSRNLDGLVVGVIGLTTCQALAVHRPADVVAPRPSHHALAMALASYLEVTA